MGVLHPCPDQVGIPTIGIGMTYYPGSGTAVTMQDPPITQDQANAYFLQMACPMLQLLARILCRY